MKCTRRKKIILFLHPDSYLAGLPTVYSQPHGELQLKRDTLLATLTSIGMEWEVSFEFKPTNYDNKDNGGYVNILHLTNGGNFQTLGDRTPAVQYHPDKGLYVATAIGSNPNSHTYMKPPPPVGQWSSIVISQIKTGSSTIVSIKINDAAPLTRENPVPKEFSSVKVYASDPWHPAQAGSIRGLKIKTQ